VPAGQDVIERVLPRQSELARADEAGRKRVLAANVDQIFVVIAPLPASTDPELDAYLVATRHLEIPTRIVCNKRDLVHEPQRAVLAARAARYRAIGYDWIESSASEGTGKAALRNAAAGLTSVFVGTSGIGKSSLTRLLAPSATPRVGALAATGRHGAHTTTTSSLHRIDGGGAIIDSPGIRSFGLWDLPPGRIAHGFPELTEPGRRCRFRDCTHRTEPGCGVRDALSAGRISVERFHSYLTLLRIYAPASPSRG